MLKKILCQPDLSQLQLDDLNPAYLVIIFFLGRLYGLRPLCSRHRGGEVAGHREIQATLTGDSGGMMGNCYTSFWG